MAVHDFKSQRLFVDVPLSGGTTIEVDRDKANYLINVLRMKDGDCILLFNGKDGEWQCEITITGRKKCTLTPTNQTRPQPTAPTLTYYFAPLKQGRLDYMVQKAVEMGVGVLQPVLTEYTQVRTLNSKRLMANAIEAAEQCGILSVPEIREPIGFQQFVDNELAETTLIFCDEDEPQNQTVLRSDMDQSRHLALLIGPEGGFSDQERKALDEVPNVLKLGLGPRILRADTAAVAALAIIQSHIGDWYR